MTTTPLEGWLQGTISIIEPFDETYFPSVYLRLDANEDTLQVLRSPEESAEPL